MFRGVPAFRCSGLFRAVPVFRCSGVPDCSGVPGCSGVPVFLVLVHAVQYYLFSVSLTGIVKLPLFKR